MRQKHIASLNDKAYLTALYQRYAPALFAYLYRHVGSMEDTEDLLLEVFLAALERSGFENLGTKEQEAWLWCVARNKMTDHHRKANRRQGVPLDLIAEERQLAVFPTSSFGGPANSFSRTNARASVVDLISSRLKSTSSSVVNRFSML